MCEQTVALFQTASAATGVCAPPDAGFPTCSSDRNCAAREACRCGRCVLALCSEQSECPPGYSCNRGRCDLTNAIGFPCPPGTAFRSGLCLPACDGVICRTGEVCVDGLCEPQTCINGAGCAVGQSCIEFRRAVSFGSPTVLIDDAGVRLWFEVRGSTTAHVRSATSADGLSFFAADAAALVAANAWEGGRVAAPSVVKTDAGYRMFYEGGSASGIGGADSVDGVTFASTTPSAPLIAPSAAWEAGRIGGPAAVAWDGPVVVYYEAGPINGRAVGVAYADGGDAFVKEGPIVTASDVLAASQTGPGWTSVVEVYAPSAFAVGSAAAKGPTWIWYSVRGVERGASIINESVGFSASSDGLRFTASPYNPAYHRFSSYLAALDEGEPSVIPWGTRGFRLYFTSRGQNDGLGAARSLVE